MGKNPSFLKLFLNYLGQVRIYSLIDLVLFLIAFHANTNQFVAIIILWLGFLALLESRHSHQYRAKVPAFISVLLFIIGLILLPHPEAVAFILLSYLYTFKNKGWFAFISPVIRGAQNLVLIGYLAGFDTIYPYVAFVITVIRNTAGDLRDTIKDREDGMKTLPIVLGFKHDYKYVHLFALMGTSFYGWYLTGLPIWWLALVYIIQWLTYFLTPR